jgi:hypothetical protein
MRGIGRTGDRNEKGQDFPLSMALKIINATGNKLNRMVNAAMDVWDSVSDLKYIAAPP